MREDYRRNFPTKKSSHNTLYCAHCATFNKWICHVALCLDRQQKNFLLNRGKAVSVKPYLCFGQDDPSASQSVPEIRPSKETELQNGLV